MQNAKFIYEVYIAAEPKKIWDALVVPEITRRYWGHENVSDWHEGSSWEHQRSDPPKQVDIIGKVIEIKPMQTLVLSWARPEEAHDKSKFSRVRIQLDPIDSMTRVTVTHDQLVEDSDTLRSITAGWPRVLSSMKSLLETGKPLDTWAGHRS